jgi:hypothetical protein
MATITKKWLASDAVDDSNIKLSNNAYLKARNFANDGDVSIVKVNASDVIEFATVPQVTSDPSANNDLVRKSYLSSYQLSSTKDQANGYAGLDSGGKVLASVLPNSVMEFKGAWNATSNVPYLSDAARAAFKAIQDITYTAKTAGAAGNSITIAYTNTVTQGNEVASAIGNAITVQIESGVSTATQVKAAVDTFNTLVDAVITGTAGTAQVTVGATALELGQDVANAGDVYRVSVAGSHDFGSGSIVFGVGDWAMFSGTVWQRSPATDAVVSVNTKTGTVVLNTDDVAEPVTPTNKWFTDVRAKTAAVVNSTAGSETDQAASVAAMKSYVSGFTSADAEFEVKTLVNQDITNQYVDLGFKALTDSCTVWPVNGPIQTPTTDYTLSYTGGAGGVTRLTFAGDLASKLAATDKLVIKYLKG